jgi:hypothetical protein
MWNLNEPAVVVSVTEGGNMRKLIVLLGVTALVSAPAALAKQRNVSMVGAPTAPKAGQAWMATISVKMDGKYSPGKAPAVRLINAAGKAVSVLSTPTSKAGIYRARLVFPTAGMWRVLVVDRMTGRSYEFNRMRVRAT